MADFKAYLMRLNNNLNILREREAKYGSNAPPELLNQIEDHRTAIALTDQVILSKLTEDEWHEALKPLLVNINSRTGEAAISVEIGDVTGGIHHSIIAGRDIIIQSNPPTFQPSSPPLQRPLRATHFTNRERELEKLLADLQPGRVVTLCGPGGIGKTALAAEAMWQPEMAARFPDGLIFHSFYNQPQANLALEHLVTSFGAEPKPTPATAALRVLAGKRILLLLDGTEDADDLQAVLEVAGSCGVLVTSRKRKDAVDERQDIQPLITSEAVKLLRTWDQEQTADTRAAEQICELVGRLPLAVRLVGKYLDATGETATEYLASLKETPLKALDQGQQRVDSVSVLLQESLAQVSETARQVLGVVGLLALAPFGREPVAAALGLEEGQVRQPLGELISYGLLLRSGERYEVSHALIHTYARERVQPEAEVVQRLAGYYTALADAESKKGLAGYQRLDGERAHIMRVLAGCAGRGEWEAVMSLVRAVDDYLDIRGYWTERVTATQTGLTAVRALGDRREEGEFLRNLGMAYYFLGQVERAIAYHEQALTIAQEIGYRQGEATDLSNLGEAYRDLGQVEQAIAYHQQALPIAREIGDRQGEATDLSNLGIAYHDLRQVEQAIGYYQQALTLDREIGYRQGEANQLGNLGNAYRDLGEVQRAIESYEQALVIACEIGHRLGEAIDLHNIGDLYKDQDNSSLARQYLEQALAIFEAIKSPIAEESRKALAELESNDPGAAQ